MISLESFRPHALHHTERHWPETNCYVDLWIEVLASRGLNPLAMLAFTVRHDFEGDQFTFFKVPLEDLERLYGISVGELSIFNDLENHLIEQIDRSRLPLVEMDGLYLPDTDGVTYRIGHSKTTIAPVVIDPAKKRMEYFHNAGFFVLEGEDYDGIFRQLPHLKAQPDLLFPYTEFAKFGPVPSKQEQHDVSLKILKYHLKFLPSVNPIAQFQRAFPAHAEKLQQGPGEFFHAYAFNTLRQLGANFELLGSYLEWLGTTQDIELKEEIEASRAIAGGAKAFQFQLARAMARSRFAGLDAQLTPLVDAYDTVFARISSKIGH